MKKLFTLLLCLCLMAGLVPAVSAGAFAEALPVEETAVLFGSPWVNTMVIGNLPETAPEAKDDFYAHVNYDVIAANQTNMYIPVQIGSAEIEPAVKALLQDPSVSVPGLDQLKIFMEQAADMEALRSSGYSEVRPYLNRIEAVSSIEELNAVLTAEDFPFSPYLVMPVAPLSLDGENGVWIYPALSLSSDYCNGANNYTETVPDFDTLQQKIPSLERVFYFSSSVAGLGIKDEDVPGAMLTLFNMEASYVKEGYSEAIAAVADYGYISSAPHHMTAEELESQCSRFPLAATLKRFGKDKASGYVVPCPAWLQALDSLWTDENLENVKLLTRFKVLIEAAPFLDTNIGNYVRSSSGMPVMDEDTNPWAVANRADTFGHLLAGLYVDKALGSELKDQLTSITQGLVSTYRDLINETEWLSDSGRAKALEKLDMMRLNVLEPDGGYYDYSGLKLTPSSEGGSLFNSYLEIKAYLNEQENSYIGKPAKADLSWKAFNPLGANCFYDPFSNSVNILPGYVMSATCPKGASEAELMGSAGTVIAHEISHAFDFAGSQCDANGLGNPILSEADRETFLEKVKAVETYYDGISILPDTYCKGTFLRVENTADLAGLRAALSLAKARGLDLDAFFRANAKLYVMVIPLMYQTMTYNLDPHAPSYLRVNVNVQMMDEFCELYDVREGDGMYVKPEDRLKTWGK